VSCGGRRLQRGGVAERPRGHAVLAAAEGLDQVAEGRLARAIEVRAERPDREEQHDHHGHDTGGDQQHQQSLPANPRRPRLTRRATVAASVRSLSCVSGRR
jgi:hypothetical protein